ncbi:cathepsin L1-like [Thalassophryne amazonica]|uniref:cathepsin L1-like n=1 Tax=Thalassophryne amazonica TaxID=390379 RepID=UPI001470E624|nr:cathepsin L1-like [Thalassophryne amazonica]
MKLLLAAAALLAVANCAIISIEDWEFHTWMFKFGKTYSSPSEEAHRKGIWLQNRKLVLMHNIMADQGTKSYRLGMTVFADLENHEYRQLISQGCLGSFNSSLPRHGSIFLRSVALHELPQTVDWRDKGYVTPVKDQKQCGSCWAFSAAGSLEGQNFRKTGTLVSLSEQQLVDCSRSFGNMGCMGGLMDQTFDYIKANGGIDTEDSYPYEAKDGPCRFNHLFIGATCTSYMDVISGDEYALQEAVATVGPVSVGIDASHESFQLYESGVYNEPMCSSSVLTHGVLVVGYGSYYGNDYWLVKNSWGLLWGDNGYIKMSKNKNNQCGIASLASYPLT